MFRCARAPLTHEANRVAVINQNHRVVFFGQIANGGKVGNNAIHREHTISDHKPVARAFGRNQLSFQFGHIVVGIAEALRLTKPDTIDD